MFLVLIFSLLLLAKAKIYICISNIYTHMFIFISEINFHLYISICRILKVLLFIIYFLFYYLFQCVYYAFYLLLAIYIWIYFYSFALWLFYYIKFHQDLYHSISFLGYFFQPYCFLIFQKLYFIITFCNSLSHFTN